MATFSLLEVLLERSGVSSAGEKMRTFGKGSSRQASNTGVVPAEGFLMLKSAMSGKFGRVTVKGSENGSLAQSFNVGLCASCCGRDTCPWRLGSAVRSFGRYLLLRKSFFLQQGRRRVCLGASRFEAGYAWLIMV
ncbi:unnamed protein product [Prunus armeniaca]